MFSTECECLLLIEHLSVSVHMDTVACGVQAGAGDVGR